MRRTKYYSAAIVVLMAMFFAADASAGWGHRHRARGGYYGGGWGGNYGGGWGGYYSSGWRGNYGGGWGGYYGTGWGGYYGTRWRTGYSPYSYYGSYVVARPSYAYYGAGYGYGGLYGSSGYGCTSCYSAPVYAQTAWSAPVYSCVPQQCGCVAACDCGGAVTGTVIGDGYQEDNQDGNIEEASSEQPEPIPPPDDNVKKQRSRIQNSIVLSVRSPADAKIYVNDHETKNQGPRRKIRASQLEAGKSYTFRVKAVHEGRAITKFVTALPGQQANMSFDFASQETFATMLTLNVPKSARVILAGSETEQQGTRRVFGTNRLSKGESMDNYLVRVSIEKGGRTLTRERTISLVEGESYEVQFDFSENLLASK